MSAFIVFEGGDGSGKTTHSRRLASALSRSGYSVVSTREPGGFPLGEIIRDWVKGPGNLSPATELLLFLADRAQHVAEVIRPALDKGEIVVCDRFKASTIAYQGYGRGIDLDIIDRLNALACGDLSPDLTVLLDLPIEESLPRRSPFSMDERGQMAFEILLEESRSLGIDEPYSGYPEELVLEEARAWRGEEPDAIDSEELEFHRRVKEGYLEQAAQNPSSWVVVDSSGPEGTVAAAIWEKVQALLRSRA